jgi:S1-C subfamily serine protease
MTTLPGLLVALVAASAPASRGEVIDFSATWCGPCQSVAPTVARLERDGFPIRSVDVDRNRDLAQRFNVTAMPTFVLIVDGKEVDRHEGIMSESELRAWLQRIPQNSLQADIAALQTTRGQSPSSFVADSNVRLGNPGPFAMQATEPARTAELETRPAPLRSQPPAAEIRASNVDLAGESVAPQAKSTPFGASVRLRVTIDGHINLGSGTIVFCENGQALIVTCGHIFRGSTPDSQIEVNLFDIPNAKPLYGKLVKFDAESDVGLIAIESDRPLPFVAVARDVQKAQVQEPVINIGCSGGQDPTTEELVVTAVNPYIGPDNLECTGVPVQGRSGGGLFRTSGELVGVCIAADPQRKRGVYAGLLAVHELLEESGHAALFRAPETAIADSGSAFDFMSAGNAATEGEALPPRDSLLGSLTPAGEFPAAPPRTAEMDAGSTSLVADELSRAPARGLPVELNNVAADAEVVCIIRSRDPARPDSQVVIIHQASTKLLSYLRGEMGTDVTAGNSGSLLSHSQPRRSRATAVPTMRVTSQTPPLPPLNRTLASVVHKPTPQRTAMVETFQPRRYVRTR